MQTFLPYPDFAESASVLDWRRLGNQRRETLQILAAVTHFKVVDGALRYVDRPGWQHHAAVRMWSGHASTLIAYGLAVCDEWVSRGYRDTCTGKLRLIAEVVPESGPPAWLGDSAFHHAHRSNLVRKYPGHYRPLWPDIPDDLPYVWPTAA